MSRFRPSDQSFGCHVCSVLDVELTEAEGLRTWSSTKFPQLVMSQRLRSVPLDHTLLVLELLHVLWIIQEHGHEYNLELSPRG